MNDEWLSEVIAHCRNHPDWLNILVSRKDLLACMQDLQRLRELESRKVWKPKATINGVCRCGGIPQTAADGTCFYCHGKVTR